MRTANGILMKKKIGGRVEAYRVPDSRLQRNAFENARIFSLNYKIEIINRLQTNLKNLDRKNLDRKKLDLKKLDLKKLPNDQTFSLLSIQNILI
jgi:chaperonin GroEL (HSP60 family)